MQAFLIFLAAVAILVVLGLLFPGKNHKTPQNDRTKRQGDTARWIETISTPEKRE